MLGHREGVDARRVADGDAAHARGIQIEVVRTRSPYRNHLEAGAGREHPVAEAGMRADVDGDLGPADAADQLLFLVGAALGEHHDVPQLLGPLVGGSAFEDRGEIVGNDDHATESAKIACAAATPAPASLR